MLLWDVWIGMWISLTIVKILQNIFYLLSTAPPNFLAAAFWPTLETKPLFGFSLPSLPRRHYEIVCGAVFQMRDVLPFQSEQQGGTD